MKHLTGHKPGKTRCGKSLADKKLVIGKPTDGAELCATCRRHYAQYGKPRDTSRRGWIASPELDD